MSYKDLILKIIKMTLLNKYRIGKIEYQEKYLNFQTPSKIFLCIFELMGNIF